MDAVTLGACALLAGALSCFLCLVLTAKPIELLMKPNYRGAGLNLTLGLSAASAAALSITSALVALAVVGRSVASPEVYAWVGSGGLAVLAAGVVDDLLTGEVRGLREHLRSTLRGRPTTGLLKVAAALGGAALVVLGLPGRPLWVTICGVVAIAGCANVWNDLDTAPGRAGKWFIIIAIGIACFAGTSAPREVLIVLMGAELPALWLDLGEKGMLGDAGSNLLGLMVGAGLYAAFPNWGVACTAVLSVALNVLGETLSFSRAIRAVPPLRWFDLLGTSRGWKDRSANIES